MRPAEEAIQKGAYDFITKPFRKETILITIKRALEWKRMQGELAALKETVASSQLPVVSYRAARGRQNPANH